MGDEFVFLSTDPPSRRLSRALRVAAMVPAAAVFLLLIAPLLALPFGYRTMIVTSGSMEPVASAGDAVVVREAAAVAVGDVITFRPLRSTRLVTHRIVDVREIGGVVHYRTQGDANQSADPDLVPAPNVVGTMVATIPGAGRVLATVTSTAGRVLLVLLPALALAGAEAKGLWTGRRRRRPVLRPVLGGRPAFRGRGALAAPLVLVLVMLMATPAGAVLQDTSSVGSNAFEAGLVAAPNLTGASADLLLCQITLTWAAPTTGLSPDGYNVYRSTTNGGPYSFVKHVGTLTSTTDTGLARNRTYHYVLQSTVTGWTSVSSNQRSATTKLLCL